MCRNSHLHTTACLDPHSAPGLLDLSVTPPSSVHAAPVDSPASCAAVASPASCAAVASPAPCCDIASNLHIGVGLSLDDCLLQRSSLSGLVALRTSTHTRSRSLGTRSPSIPAVRSPDVLVLLSCEPTAARTLDATPTPQSDLPAVAAPTPGVHLTASIARPRVIDDLRLPSAAFGCLLNFRVKTANFHSGLPATPSQTKSLSVRIPRSLESTLASRLSQPSGP